MILYLIKKHERQLVFTSHSQNNIYKIILYSLEKQDVKCLKLVNEEKLIWHKRLGHANLILILKLNKLQLVRVLPKLSYKT